MRSQKGSRKIVINGVEYRWRATGNDGYISVSIWPTNDVGAFIRGSFKYHETWTDNGDGSRSSAGDQIIVTNHIVRRVIEHAVAEYGYDPHVSGKELTLQGLDDTVQWDDTVRGKSRS